MKKLALILVFVLMMTACGSKVVPLKEVTVDYWDSNKGIKEFKGNYIVTTENEVYYQDREEWIKDEVLTSFDGDFEMIDRYYFISGGVMYYHMAGMEDLAMVMAPADLQIGKAFCEANMFWAIDEEGKFRVFTQPESGAFQEIELPEQMVETGVKDFVGRIYITQDGEAREFVWAYDGPNHIHEELYANAFIASNATLVDAGNGHAIVQSGTGDLYPAAHSKKIAAISEPVIAAYGYSVIQTSKGYFCIENDKVVPAAALNAYKDRVVSIGTRGINTPVMVLDDGKVYEAK